MMVFRGHIGGDIPFTLHTGPEEIPHSAAHGLYVINLYEHRSLLIPGDHSTRKDVPSPIKT